jgi:hypothetical protein
MHATISVHEPPATGKLEPGSESRSAPSWPFALLLMMVGAVGILTVAATFFAGATPACVYAHPSFDEDCTLEHLAR